MTEEKKVQIPSLWASERCSQMPQGQSTSQSFLLRSSSMSMSMSQFLVVTRSCIARTDLFLSRLGRREKDAAKEEEGEGRCEEEATE